MSNQASWNIETINITINNKLWQCIASDSSGINLIACCASTGGIYISSTSGSTWTKDTQADILPINANWQYVASDSTGTNLMACHNTNGSGDIYTSVNSGGKWTKETPSSANWFCIASDSSGTKLVAVAFGSIGIYTKSSGTWTKRTIGLPTTSTNWRSVSSSSDGTKLVACSSNSTIYTSTDSGVSWTSRGTVNGLPATANWFSISSNSSGSNLVACVFNGTIYTSTDSGLSWATRGTVNGLPATAGWQSVSSNSDGNNLVACVSNGTIYTSTNGGLNWTSRGTVNGLPNTNLTWKSITSDSTGNKLAACINNGNIYTSTDAGLNWTLQLDQKPNTANWKNVCINGSNEIGYKMVASIFGNDIYTSNSRDAGTPWYSTSATNISGNTNLSWQSIVNNLDGTKIVACNNSIYTCVFDYVTHIGVWAKTGAPSLNWWSVACDSTGNKIVACSNGATGSGFIYTADYTSDSSGTWTKRINGLPATAGWKNVTSDSSGMNLVASIGNYNGSTYGIYTSNDSGNNWIKRTNNLPISVNFNNVASNSLGTILATSTTTASNGLYISTNSGQDWTQKKILNNPNIVNIAINSDGTILVACSNVGNIYISKDFSTDPIGNFTLQTNTSGVYIQNAYWQSVAINNDGTRLMASAQDDFIYNAPTFCFNHNTKILCLNNKLEEEYIPIQNLCNGDLVKSYLHGYRRITHIVNGVLINKVDNMWNMCMYKMEKTEENGLIEDLIVTGGHALLVDSLSDEDQDKQTKMNLSKKIDDKVFLWAGVSNKFKQIESGLYNWYHFILENDGDNDRRYGVWANGILTETPSVNQILIN